MVDDGSAAAARRLLLRRPGPPYFYLIYREDSTGSTGESTFHGIATDPQSCREAIQRLCAGQRAASAEEIAGLEELPEDELPYDPLLPSGGSAALCVVLPDMQRYVLIHSQRWDNQGRTHHPELIPDIFDVAYYRDKVLHGEYERSRVRS